jgi:hypothetical protein
MDKAFLFVTCRCDKGLCSAVRRTGWDHRLRRPVRLPIDKEGDTWYSSGDREMMQFRQTLVWGLLSTAPGAVIASLPFQMTITQGSMECLYERLDAQ